MYRIVDLIFSLIGLVLGFPFLLIIYLLVFFDIGSPLFIQERVGKNKKAFMLIKFRTMHLDTISVASHLVSKTSITTLGRFLRKTKLDEFPQLWNVLKGDMSLVGPRPNLFNQLELIREREKKNVYSVRPGITGLAQINNIDMSTPATLANADSVMISQLTLKTYFSYILKTIIGSGKGDAVI